MRLCDLPPHLRTQAERQLFPAKPAAAPAQAPAPAPQKRPDKPAASKTGNLAPYKPQTRQKPPLRPFGSCPNQTEAAYNREVLHGKGRFEPVTFHLLGGSRYTPDFLTIDEGVLTFHEVKGSYRLESEGRAWTAFNSAAAQYPFFRWVWAVRAKRKSDGWTVKRLIKPIDISADLGDTRHVLPQMPT